MKGSRQTANAAVVLVIMREIGLADNASLELRGEAGSEKGLLGDGWILEGGLREGVKGLNGGKGVLGGRVGALRAQREL